MRFLITVFEIVVPSYHAGLLSIKLETRSLASRHRRGCCVDELGFRPRRPQVKVSFGFIEQERPRGDRADAAWRWRMVWWSEMARRSPGTSIRPTPGAPTQRDDGDTCKGLARGLSLGHTRHFESR